MHLWTAIAIILSTIVSIAHAEIVGRPPWTVSPPVNSSEYKHYVGRASEAHNEQEAFRNAYADAYSQAIAQNFGTRIQLERQTYTTEKSVSMVSKVNESTHLGGVELRGFALESYFVEQTAQGKYNVWVHFKYDTSEIEREKRRLSKAKGKAPAIEYSEVGSLQDQSQGVLQIFTVPPDAQVVVDNDARGRTPIRLNGQLAPGPHRVRLEHPQFVTLEREVIIGPGQKVTLSEELVRAEGKIDIHSQPQGAQVSINGKDYGQTPLKNIKLPVGLTHQLSLTHPQTEPKSISFQVQKFGNSPINESLILRPARLSIHSQPSQAIVYINGLKVGTTPTGPIEVSAGTQNLVIKKEGFPNYSGTISLAGGENHVLPVINLSKDEVSKSEIETPSGKRTELYEPSHFFSLSLEHTDSIFTHPDIAMDGIRLAYTRMFWSRLGLEASFGMLSGSERIGSEGKELNFNAYSTRLGAPVLINSSTSKDKISSFLLQAYLSHVSLRYSEVNDPEVESQHLGSAYGSGLRADYRMTWENTGFTISLAKENLSSTSLNNKEHEFSTGQSLRLSSNNPISFGLHWHFGF